MLVPCHSYIKYGKVHKLNLRKNCLIENVMSPNPLEMKHTLHSIKGCLYLPIFKAHEIFPCLAFHTCRQLLWGVSTSFYQGMMQSGNKMTQPWHHQFRSVAGRGRKLWFCSKEEKKSTISNHDAKSLSRQGIQLKK